MVSLEKAEDMLADLIDELPEAFFEELNGGVCLIPEAKPDPDFPGEDLYILGEYCEDGCLGRSIVIYYGSFEPVFGDMSPLEFRRELRDTLRHEFRHHVESLAGENGLDLEDEEWLVNYVEETRGGGNDTEMRKQKAYEKGLSDGKRAPWWKRFRKD